LVDVDQLEQEIEKMATAKKSAAKKAPAKKAAAKTAEASDEAKEGSE
jgi:hypothetical protein